MYKTLPPSFPSFTEIINESRAYANSAHLAIRFDAETFPSVPSRMYRVRGTLIKIPHNGTVRADGSISYTGTFNGTFKTDKEYSNEMGTLLRRFFGTKASAAGFELDKVNNADLEAYVRYEALEWAIKEIETLRKKKDVVSIDDIMPKLKQIENTFKTGDGKTLVNLRDEYFSDADGIFSLDWAAKNNKAVRTAIDDAILISKNAIDGNVVHLKEKIKKVKDNVDFLKTRDSAFNSPKAFFENIAVTGGLREFERLKNAATADGLMSVEDFNEAARSLISQHLNNSVFSISRNTTLYGESKQLAKPIMDTDFDLLASILSGDEPYSEATKVIKEVFAENHYNTLLDIARYMDLQKSEHGFNAITGVPKAMSVESWISRIYSINRGVISPKYVATEALLQQGRVSQFSLLREIMQNPASADVFKDILLSGQKLDTQLNARFTTALLASATWYGHEYGYQGVSQFAHTNILKPAGTVAYKGAKLGISTAGTLVFGN